jgi:hypothetical protein
VRFILQIISRNLAQNGTFWAKNFSITFAMFEEPTPKQRRIIQRTLTITTVETWTITIGAARVTAMSESDEASATVIETIIEPVSANCQTEM